MTVRAIERYLLALPGARDETASAAVRRKIVLAYRNLARKRIAAGDAPSRAQVQLRQDGRIVFTKGMAAAVNTPCWQGRIYRTSILINRRGQYEYRFRFADATGAARGAPTRWKSGLRVTESSQGMPAITSLVATPTNAGAQLTFDLGAQADVTARVLNLAGRPIRTICRAKALEAGTRTLVWNAQDDSGDRAGPCMYSTRHTEPLPNASRP